MKLLYVIIISSALAFILNSCVKEEYYNIDRDKWFLFNENDTLRYKSALSIDTFVISDITHTYSDIDKELYVEYLMICFDKYSSNNDSIRTEYYIQRDCFAFYLRWRNLYKIIDYTENTPEDYNLNNIIIKDVYTVVADSSIDTLNNNNIKSAYYSDKYGVVAYKLVNDILFELDTACLK